MKKLLKTLIVLVLLLGFVPIVETQSVSYDPIHVHSG